MVETMHRIPDTQLSDHFERWLAHTRHSLAEAVTETFTVDEVLALGSDDDRDTFNFLALTYSEPRGSLALREAIASTYNQLSADDVLCLAGADEALYLLLQDRLGPNDHAIVLVPNYEALELIPMATGASVTGVLLSAELNWAFDIDALKAAVRPNTRVIAVNFPHNPTGTIPPHEIFKELVEFCEERSITLLSDEVYRGLEFDPARRLTQAADLSSEAVSLNVVSKAYGMPGLRVGWIASRDHNLLRRIERNRHHITLCNSAPSEMLATIALQNREAVLERNRAIVARNLGLLDDFFSRHCEFFNWQRPDGGCLAFPEYLGSEGAEAFCQQAIQEAGVLLLPSSLYKSELAKVSESHFRIGFGTNAVPGALAALETIMVATPNSPARDE